MNKSSSKWYNTKEASALIDDVLGTNLGQKYWTKFIYNHSRGIRSTKDKENWFHLDTVTNKSKRIMIHENELQRFLDEGQKRNFPLGNTPHGYTRKPCIQKVNKSNEELVDVPESAKYVRIVGDEYKNTPTTFTIQKFDETEYIRTVQQAAMKDAEVKVDFNTKSALVHFEGCQFKVTKDNIEKFRKIFTLVDQALAWND